MNRSQSKKNVCKPSHFSINVHAENSDNNKQNQESKPLHQSYAVYEMLDKSKSDTPESSQSETPRIKLRDYLFRAKTAANRAAVQKRKKIEEVREQSNSIAKAELKMQSSRVQLRRFKYGLEDREMFQALRKEIEIDLEEGIKQMQQIKSKINSQLNQMQPSGESMRAMYDIRVLLKDKIRSSLTTMEKSFKNFAQQEQPSISDEPDKLETEADPLFTNALLNKNIELFEMQLQHRFSFGRT